MKIDKTNIEIIKQLRDGRKSFRKIAEELSITENTVRSRVNKLQEDGILEIAGIIDAESLPGHQQVIFGVKLQNMDLLAKAEEFSKLECVISSCVVTGRFDLIVVVILNEEHTLLEFITQKVGSIEGVKSIESFVVFKGFNMKVPYVL